MALLSHLAAQHGIHWVSLGLLSGWNTHTSTNRGDNRTSLAAGEDAELGRVGT